MCRVHPSGTTSKDEKKGKRKIFLRWIAVFAGFPLTYLTLPISCCVRNPTAHVLYSDGVSYTNDNNECFNKMTENIAIGCFSASSIFMCCGCCCGHCCKIDPLDF